MFKCQRCHFINGSVRFLMVVHPYCFFRHRYQLLEIFRRVVPNVIILYHSIEPFCIGIVIARDSHAMDYSCAGCELSEFTGVLLTAPIRVEYQSIEFCCPSSQSSPQSGYGRVLRSEAATHLVAYDQP